MKKSEKVIRRTIFFTIVALIILAIIIGIVVAVTTKGKKSITSEEFKSFMENKQYEVINVNEQFAEYSYITNAYVATKDLEYQIEFYEISNENDAISFYNNNKSIFQSYKESGYTESAADVKDYSRYTLAVNNKYMFISRSKNTVIYAKVDLKYKDEVMNIIDELDY